MKAQSELLRRYVIVTGLLSCVRCLLDQSLYQRKPFFYFQDDEIISKLFIGSGIPDLFLSSPALFAVADLIFMFFPFILLIAHKYKRHLFLIAAYFWFVISAFYALLFCVFTYHGYHAVTAWVIIPVIFCVTEEKKFLLLHDFIRYFFLFFFFSAGIWKVLLGGAFNVEQMSQILTRQHADILVIQPQAAYSNAINYLIQHPAISCIFFSAAVCVQLSFGIGFFTKRFDRLLLCFFVVFLIADYFLMRIPYLETVPYLLFLCYQQPRQLAFG